MWLASRTSLTTRPRGIVDYFAHGNKVARHDPVKRYQLLSIKADKNAALLPILSGASDAATKSPLFPFVDAEDPTDAAGNILSPVGPWNFRFQLKVPGMSLWHLSLSLPNRVTSITDCTTKIHFTNKYSKARIAVSHAIKIVMRVDRGDDSELDAKGKVSHPMYSG